MTPAFWSTETFLERQKKHSIVSNFDEIRLNHGRYSLRLSREVLVTPDGTSDAALNQRIQKLEDHVNSIIAVGLVIIFPFLVGFASTTFDNWLGKTAATDKPTILRLIVGTSVITCFVVGALFAGYRFWRRRKSSY